MDKRNVLMAATALTGAMGSEVAQAQQPGPQPPQAPAGVIGTAAAVNPAARSLTGTPRVLFVGNQLRQNERITTDAAGQAHIMFLDQSALTIGGNSDVTLDRFVYDPARDTGQLTAQVGRGVLRFVGGRISHQGNVEIRTPTATIGIRGAVVMARLLPNGSILIVHVFGSYTRMLFPNGRVVEINRPGYGGVFTGTGDGAIRPMTQQEINQLLADLEGGNGQPTDQNQGQNASGNRPPWTLVPDWLQTQIANWGGLGVGDFRGLDLRRLEELLSQREGANQRLRDYLIQMQIPPTSF